MLLNTRKKEMGVGKGKQFLFCCCNAKKLLKNIKNNGEKKAMEGCIFSWESHDQARK